MFSRRTKIVATLGPATDGEGVLDRLVEAGMDCARLNCSHGGADDLRRRAAGVRAAAERAGRPIALLFDLQGPKLRLAGDVEARTIERDQRLTFCGAGNRSHDERVTVEFERFSALVTDRSQIVIGDGVPRFAVDSISDGDVMVRALSAGRISPRKGVNVTYAHPQLPAVTEKDSVDLALAAELGADFVALSFVRSATDMLQLRRMLQEHGATPRTIAKIEKVEGYENLDEVMAACDGVMVARGDYGVEAGFARLPLMQKDTITRATQVGKVVITATHMLESMTEAPEPTRAEVADVANAVIDGSSAVMLSAESSVGQYPVEAVAAMAEIAVAAEQAPAIHGRARAASTSSTGEAVLHAAVELADEVDAVALVIPTSTGGAPRACSKYRSRCPIIALAHHAEVADALALEWGVYPTSMDAAANVDEMIDQALATARDFAGLESGARVVITAGRRTGTPGATNLVMVREIP